MIQHLACLLAASALSSLSPVWAASGPYDDSLPLRVVDAQGTVVGRCVFLYLADSPITGDHEFHAHSELWTNGKCKTPNVHDVHGNWRFSSPPVDLGYLQLPFSLQ